MSFSVIPPTRSSPQRYSKMCVVCSHDSAGVVRLMWCQIVKVPPVHNDMLTQSKLKLFHVNRLARSYSIQKAL